VCVNVCLCMCVPQPWCYGDVENRHLCVCVRERVCSNVCVHMCVPQPRRYGDVGNRHLCVCVRESVCKCVCVCVFQSPGATGMLRIGTCV